MKRTYTARRGGNDGVALIIVLGLLSILTLLAVAFAIAMRIERMISRNYMNAVRAGHLVETGVRRAMENINENLVREAFPPWEARWSSGHTNFGAMLEGEAADHFPKSIWAQVDAAANACQWTNIDMGYGVTGRIAWVAGNVGGLLDPIYAGGSTWQFGTNPAEISLRNFPDIEPNMEGVFDFNRRTRHRNYETLTELAALNPDVVVPEPSHFFPYSYDPCPDQVFLLPAYDPNNAAHKWYRFIDGNSPPLTMGLRGALLHDKFNINCISNYVGYTDPGNYNGYTDDAVFMQDYYAVLTNLFQRAGVYRYDDTAWNLVNFLDPDSVPQSYANIRCPWRHSEGGEAIPLINEIVVRQCGGSAPPDLEYEVVVELWYPFAPAVVKLEDKFFLEVGIFTNLIKDAPEDPLLSANHIMTQRYEPWSFTCAIDNMAYGCSGSAYEEFRLYSTDPDANPTIYEGGAGQVIKFPGGTGIGGTSNCIYFLARVVKADNNGHYGGWITNPVDEAMGYDNPSDGEQVGGNSVSKRQMVRFSQERGYEVAGPRSNGQVKYWTSAGKGASQQASGAFTGGTPIGGRDYPPNQNTLGTTNQACLDIMKDNAQGTPIMFKNGPMDNIGELGYLFLSNLDDESTDKSLWYWASQELMCTNGANLMDVLTVRTLSTNSWERAQRGLVAINTRNKEVIKTLMKNQLLGFTNEWAADLDNISPGGPQAVADAFVDAVTYGERDSYYRYADFFWDTPHKTGCSDDNTRIAEAFRSCMLDPAEISDIRREDPFRNMCELISFRQNLFTIAVAAQVLAADGEPAGEKRAVAVVYRDAYTGRYFTRSLKWLSD